MDEARANEAVDVFMCVHRRDVGARLAASIRSYLINFQPKGQLHLVTNDAAELRGFLAGAFPGLSATVWPDEAWLQAREQSLPGWFKQQLIKLRAFRFCETPFFCNLGADTLLLEPITRADLVAGGRQILYYSLPAIPNQHTLFEMRRLVNVARVLKVWPWRSMRYVDFINDFFCFDAARLRDLDEWITAEYGCGAYADLLSGLDPHCDQTQFGEWTLYSVFILDRQGAPVAMKNAARGYLQQIHSTRDLRKKELTGKVVHLVNRDLSDSLVRQKLLLRNPGLADCFNGRGELEARTKTRG
jgi:hypothetical protein